MVLIRNTRLTEAEGVSDFSKVIQLQAMELVLNLKSVGLAS